MLGSRVHRNLSGIAEAITENIISLNNPYWGLIEANEQLTKQIIKQYSTGKRCTSIRNRCSSTITVGFISKSNRGFIHKDSLVISALVFHNVRRPPYRYQDRNKSTAELKEVWIISPRYFFYLFFAVKTFNELKVFRWYLRMT